MLDSCELGNKPSVFIKVGEFMCSNCVIDTCSRRALLHVATQLCDLKCILFINCMMLTLRCSQVTDHYLFSYSTVCSEFIL